MVLLSVLVLFLIPYLLLLIGAASQQHTSGGLKRFTQITPEPIYILLPIRNEEGHIGRTLNSIFDNDLEAHNAKILIIDDHSTDQGIKIAENVIKSHHAEVNASIITLQKGNNGKKAAIELGLQTAKECNQFITVDGDCVYSDKWLSSMVAAQRLSEADVVIGYTEHSIASGNGLIQSLQLFETNAIKWINHFLTKLKKPVVATGANLFFKRDAHPGVFKESTLSGDDMELLLYAKQKHKKIYSITKAEACCRTPAVKRPDDLTRQRIRWASKRFIYKDSDVLLMVLVIGLGNVVALLSLIGSMSQFILILPFTVKILADACLQFKGKMYDSWIQHWVYFILIELIYPIYIIFIPLISGFVNVNWKGRSLIKDGKERAGILF